MGKNCANKINKSKKERETMRKLKGFLNIIAAVLLAVCLSVPATAAEEAAKKVLKPEAPGKKTKTASSVTIDYSNCDSGYVMVKYSGTGKIKVIISKSGKKDYTYDLVGKKYNVYPLSVGDGKYTVSVYKNISGTQYSTLTSASFEVKLKNANLPFLYPNQFVDFNSKSKAVEKAASITKNNQNDIEKIETIYNFVVNNLTYDTHKANTVKSGYLPEVDDILASGKGICFDYASLMAAMMRSQGIPTKLEIGYVSGGLYHAWLSTYIEEIGWVNGIIQFDGKNWRRMDPTFASSANQSGSIMSYIGDGSNYKTQYIY